jgi:hypothetical protein
MDNLPPDPLHQPPRPVPPSSGSMPPLQGQLPTSRASDILRANAKPVGASGAGVNASGPDPDFGRRATPLDDSASGLLGICALLFIAAFAYLLWGMWGGAFADPNFTTVYDHANRARVLENIDICSKVMWCSAALGMVLYIFLFYQEEYAGYTLLAVGAFMFVGVQYITGLVFKQFVHLPNKATTQIETLFYDVSWIIGIPGIVLAAINIAVNFVEKLKTAQVRRATLKFGQQTVKEVKPRNVFLGACWNMPYCKESLRSRCPIFTQKRGPCWRNKRGCMCDQTIVLIAQSPNWKQSVTATVGQLDGKMGRASMPELPPQPVLSKEAKNERCRQCVIYNVHQEQKYKLGVGMLLIGSVVAITFFNAPLLAFAGDIFMTGNSLVSQLSMSAHMPQLFPNGAPGFVEWLMLISVVLVVVSKLIQMIEFACFKLKI